MAPRSIQSISRDVRLLSVCAIQLPMELGFSLRSRSCEVEVVSVLLIEVKVPGGRGFGRSRLYLWYLSSLRSWEVVVISVLLVKVDVPRG